MSQLPLQAQSTVRRTKTGLQVALLICNTGEQQMSEQGRIMCAVDLSWRSEGAFDYAVALAKSRRAPLDLLFAVSPRLPFSWRARERVAQLAKLRRLASAADVDMTVTVQHGKPADVILQHATSSNYRVPAIDRARRAQSPWPCAIQFAVRCAGGGAPDRPSNSRRAGLRGRGFQRECSLSPHSVRDRFFAGVDVSAR